MSHVSITDGVVSGGISACGGRGAPGAEAHLRDERPTVLVLLHDGDHLEELVRALEEAAGQDATVLAVALIDSGASQGRRDRALAALEAQVLRVVGLTGVHGRSRTALLDPLVYEALAATARGGDFVVVRPQGRVVLRQAGRGRQPLAVAG